MGSGGGGLCVYFNDPPEYVVISGNAFIGNTCSDGPMSVSFRGGMWLAWSTTGAPILISSNEFIGNYASLGGGMSLSASNCTVSECNFEGNSSWSGGGINVGSSVEMSKCTITGNSGEAGGISIDSYGELTMDSCTVANNIGDGIRSNDSSCIANYCNILGNTGYGMYTEGMQIDGRWNWWGDPSGPGGVGPGTGDEVSSNVLYVPWLTELGIEEGIYSDVLGLSLTPNPFSESSTIRFETPASGPVRLQVFDLSGRLVETLHAGDLQEGSHSIELSADGYNNSMYLIRLQSVQQYRPKGAYF